MELNKRETKMLLRIKENKNGGFYVQKRTPFLLVFHRWKNIRVCSSFCDALMFKAAFIPKGALDTGNAPWPGTSGILYEVVKSRENEFTNEAKTIESEMKEKYTTPEVTVTENILTEQILATSGYERWSSCDEECKYWHLCRDRESGKRCDDKSKKW